MKAIRCGDLVAADKIRDAPTAIDAKRIGNCVTTTDEWREEKETVMVEILTNKAEQCAEFQDKLKESHKNTIFADTTYDLEWGTGLNKSESFATKSSHWPGENKLGKLLKKVVPKTKKQRKSSVGSKEAAKNAKQKDIGVMLKEIRENQAVDQSESWTEPDDGTDNEA